MLFCSTVVITTAIADGLQLQLQCRMCTLANDYSMTMLKRILSIILFFLALFAIVACIPDSINGSGGNQNNPEDRVVTGEALNITTFYATLTGYANLPLELGDAEVGIIYDKKQSFEEAKKIVTSDLDGNNKFTVTVAGLSSNTKYYFMAYVQNETAIEYGAVRSFKTKELKFLEGAVDLGLPSGLKWASCNVGANVPEEYGDYFAWGETEPYYTKDHSQDSPCSSWRSRTNPAITGYNEASYKWYNGSLGSLFEYTKYGNDDNNNVLVPEDDAAQVNWGGNWRMPTVADWTELRTECTWRWVTVNGVNGRLVIGPNENRLFLPAAGCRYDSCLDHAGSNGYYWSSSRDDFPSSARCVFFNSGHVDRDYGQRYYGLSVRPVTE